MTPNRLATDDITRVQPADAKERDLLNLRSRPPILAIICLMAFGATRAPAMPPAIGPQSSDPVSAFALPKLRPPVPGKAFEPPPGLTLPQSALIRQGTSLPPPKPLPVTWLVSRRDRADLPLDAVMLRAAFQHEVAAVQQPSRAVTGDVASRALALLGMSGRTIDTGQVVLVVDRNPAVQKLYLMLARPGGAGIWRTLGAVRVSTGQAGRKDHYITPIGVFAHTDAILDYRAQGTFNENHVRGLGVAGMRVWDFGWQWAVKGWHIDGEGGDIRLEMHATDPDLLERRLGHPASEGCIRLSSSMNRFLDSYGVLDADYEKAANRDVRYAALLSPDRTPTKLAGRFLVVIDSALPIDTPPTAGSRPADWPSQDAATQAADQATPGAPGTDTSPDAPVR